MVRLFIASFLPSLLVLGVMASAPWSGKPAVAADAAIETPLQATPSLLAHDAPAAPASVVAVTPQPTHPDAQTAAYRVPGRVAYFAESVPRTAE